ncbi:MAG TPA: Nif3-like dinuclear metal center hexameric protein [Candidatus Gallimonas intestinigallinarum]|uniref:GTP cyclohydrolase 1 type 2 homolog n=1 Tax=Candidatus Gallimonas intestinigallinarum TaxID=2838604 RepID=A0A9D2DVP1_9FIRM|nr:Nif3-like dinuclear metal center hexameric protein [Candidatus Gallimonas intestinigallinarum]
MQLKNVYEQIDALAPFALSKEYCDTYKFYDNSGVIVDCGGEVRGVLCSLDLSMRAVEEAKKAGANVIVTHHPAIYQPVSSLKQDSAVLACAQAGISVISAHLNLDSAAGGIDEELMLGLGGISGRSMHILTDGSYGKAFAVHEEPLDSFVARVKARFQTERVVVYGTRPVKKVASFCGAGMDDETVAFALTEGADTFVSSDAKHHHIAALVEHGVNVVLLTHYAAENYGFVRFAENLKNKLKGLPVTVFTDERLL